LKSLFAPINRGILLDILVFVLNLVAMGFLTDQFVGLIQDANSGSLVAYYILFFFCVGIFVLPPLGTTLKRWHFHLRRGSSVDSASPVKPVYGCLFDPIIYLCLNILIVCSIIAYGFQIFYGDKEPDGAIFVSAVMFGVFLAGLQTYIVYRYFSPPTKAPSFNFLRKPVSETIGDALLYLNMIAFELILNMLLSFPSRPVSGVTDFFGRLFFITFITLLIYLPPRLYYLAEDIRRPRAILTILLANSPIIFRVVFGIG
jgi:hypothetical protein